MPQQDSVMTPATASPEIVPRTHRRLQVLQIQVAFGASKHNPQIIPHDTSTETEPFHILQHSNPWIYIRRNRRVIGLHFLYSVDYYRKFTPFRLEIAILAFISFCTISLASSWDLHHLTSRITFRILPFT